MKRFREKIDKLLRRSLEAFEEANLVKAAKMKEKHKYYSSLSKDLGKQHYVLILEGMKEP